jgi:hypothetical protein
MILIQETIWFKPTEKLPEEVITKDIFEKGFSDYVLIQMGEKNYSVARYFYPLSKWVIPNYCGDNWKPLYWTKINHPDTEIKGFPEGKLLNIIGESK